MGNIVTSSGETSASSRSQTADPQRSGGGVLFYLHRTWAIIVTEKWTRSRHHHQRSATATGQQSAGANSDTFSDLGSQYSQYSFCSCSQCQRDDGFSSACDSELFGGSSIMAPNSEDSARIGHIASFDDHLNKEKQRPPIYNPEDYALSLKKWGRKSSNGTSVALYPTPASLSASSGNIIGDLEFVAGRGHHHHQSSSFRDYRNPMLMSAGSEMTLRQFGTVTELLNKLKSDLRLAYPSFVQEFVGEPLDGVALLLDLLRGVQLSQTAPPAGGKTPPALQRRALLDEFSCLQCLSCCCQRYADSIRKLTASSSGLFTLAMCIMSNVTKSRVLALELLARACRAGGHAAVSEAMSTLRLRFGEPVRFRFLVGMLMSAGGQGELLAVGMRFLNTFLETAGGVQQRLYVQAELEQAGFDIAAIKKNISINSPSTEQVFEELDQWEKKYLDVEGLIVRLESTERENDEIRDKVLLLERRVQILLEEKGILISLEQCLKERCSELQEEVHSLKSEKSVTCSTASIKKKKDSRHEDEGISSSECSPTPDENAQRDSSVYEIFATPTIAPPKPTPPDDYDDETTIDDVIEELRNIINDAETQTYKSRYSTTENEIIPSNLHPQPPRRSKSLVHLFIPTDYDYARHKELFFENETAYTSEEGSDSLLSASKYQLPRLEPKDGGIKRADSITPKAGDDTRKKSKSLDRIDDGLETMVDIVVTGGDLIGDGGRSFEQKMFLPLKRDHSDIPYYFPRVQEKKSNSFLIKRGHANAGLYSGHQVAGEKKASKSGSGVGSIEFSFRSGGVVEKVTDLPSGLY